jgi:hypothetical protein
MTSPLQLTGLIASTTNTTPFVRNTPGTTLSESLHVAIQTIVVKPLEWFAKSSNKAQLDQILRIANRVLMGTQPGRALGAHGELLGKVPQRDGLRTLSTELNMFQNTIREYLENEDN